MKDKIKTSHRIKMVCEECGQEYLEYLSNIKRRNCRFCSPKCFHTWWARQMKTPEYLERCVFNPRDISPNKLETKFIALCRDYRLPFKFVGDGSILFESLNPDFIDTDGSKKLIEIFGDFYHNEKAPFRRWEHVRRKVFKKYGFDLLVIWEHELKEASNEQIMEKVKAFMERRLEKPVPRIFKCPECNFESPSRKAIAVHRSMKHEPKSYTCFCGFVAKNRGELGLHRFWQHSPKEQILSRNKRVANSQKGRIVSETTREKLRELRKANPYLRDEKGRFISNEKLRYSYRAR